MLERPNPRIITNNFRSQDVIEAELAKAKKLQEKKHKNSADYVDIGLTFLESNDWTTAIHCSSEAIKLEEQKEGEKTNEIIATAGYILATQQRESNDCEVALLQYTQAMRMAQSDWLKSNILRNIGLAHLKKQDYIEAAKYFKQALDLVNQDGNLELRGSLPALSNYYGLSLAKAALKSNQNPAEGIKILEETTRLYDTIFAEKKFNADAQLRCHDLQSHRFHRGMILCEIAEKQCEQDKEDALLKFTQAEALLLGALTGRRKNKADDQRLGDVYVWLGRAAAGCNKTTETTVWFTLALMSYTKAFPTTSGTQEANQIKDVRSRLEKLGRPSLATFTYGHSTFKSSCDTPEADQIVQDVSFQRLARLNRPSSSSIPSNPSSSSIPSIPSNPSSSSSSSIPSNPSSSSSSSIPSIPSIPSNPSSSSSSSIPSNPSSSSNVIAAISAAQDTSSSSATNFYTIWNTHKRTITAGLAVTAAVGAAVVYVSWRK